MDSIQAADVSNLLSLCQFQACSIEKIPAGLENLSSDHEQTTIAELFFSADSLSSALQLSNSAGREIAEAEDSFGNN